MNEVKLLYHLQSIDSEWQERNQQLADVLSQLGDTDELLSARKAVTEAEKALDDLRSKMRVRELDIAAVNDKLKKNQDRLYGSKVRSPKELASLQEEAAAFRRRRSELEDGQLDLMIAIEAAEAELEERRTRLSQLEASWRADQSSLLAEKENLETRLRELEDERSDQRSRIGSRELALYDELKADLGGVAVARLKQDICQFCRVNVPTGVARAVQRGEGMHYCPTCGRLLAP
jgi:hypothetical protein